MPGARLRSFRLGDRSELLVEQLLAAIAFTTRVPRQEDVGIDFVCSLITGIDDANLLGAGPSFSVQAKSSLEPVIYAKPHELEWIRNQDNPLLLCIADRKASAMDVYSTWNLLCGVEGGGWEGKQPASCIRLHPSKSGSNWMGIENHPDNSQDIFLGNPIIRITHDQIFDEVSTQHIAEVIAEWLELDRENIVNHRAGLNWVAGPLTYETGKSLSSERGVSFYWHPQNLVDSARNLMRSATALWRVLHVNGIQQIAVQPPWSEVIAPLGELLRWARKVDPSLIAFLPDLEKTE
jgi:hypothetical protein